MTALPAAEENDHELLTTRDVAALLRVPESTLRYWRSNGRGPRGRKVGARYLYRRVVVDQWIAETFSEGA